MHARVCTCICVQVVCACVYMHVCRWCVHGVCVCVHACVQVVHVCDSSASSYRAKRSNPRSSQPSLSRHPHLVWEESDEWSNRPATPCIALNV